MDQITLVGHQVDDGLKLIRKLADEGIVVAAACWIKADEETRWYLYIATPLVDQGLTAAYRRVHAVLNAIPVPLWVDPLEIRLISPNHSVAKAVADMYKGHSPRVPKRFGGASLGEESIEAAFIYPPDITPTSTVP